MHFRETASPARLSKRRAVASLAAIAIATAGAATAATRPSGPAPTPARAAPTLGAPGTDAPAAIRPADAPIVVSADVGGGPAVERAVASAGDIRQVPGSALLAYQRASTVLAGAEKRCGLDWSLLAAIAGLTSNHGRTATKPVGAGPFGITNVLWSQAAVDADGDGRRDVTDIDDAALGMGVLLCSTRESLATVRGARAALGTLNDSAGFVRDALRLAQSFQRGDYTVAGAPVLAARVGIQDYQPVATEVPVIATVGGSVGAGPGTEQHHWTATFKPASPHETPGRPLPPGPALPLSAAPTSAAPTGPTPAEPTPTPTPAEPSPAEPTPTPTPAEPTPAKPTPAEPTPAEPTPAKPAPSQPQVSATKQLTGVLAWVDGSWFLGDQGLDLGTAAYLARAAGADFDGDGAKIRVTVDPRQALPVVLAIGDQRYAHQPSSRP